MCVYRTIRVTFWKCLPLLLTREEVATVRIVAKEMTVIKEDKRLGQCLAGHTLYQEREVERDRKEGQQS